METVMTTEKKDLIDLLQSRFNSVKSRNSSYSYRALARDVGVSHATLLNCINYKRNFSPALAYKICKYLELNEAQTLHYLVEAMSKEISL